MSRLAGIPLLSGPPPPRSGPSQSACKRCGKEFSILFNRRRECMHCGYDYCSSCTDYQALVPRRSPTHGYDLAPVCAFCFDMLSVTALGRGQLRSLPLAKLRRYIDAYNIQIKNPIDKNDLVDAVIAARTPQGCLSPLNEDYYRKHSVPSPSTPGPSSSSANRNSSTRGFPSTNTNSNSNTRPNRPFPRPDLDPNHRQHPQEAPYSTYTPRRASNTQRPRTTSTPGATRPSGGQPNISRPTSSAGRQSTPHSTDTHASSQPAPPPPFPPPPMSTLVTLPRSSLSALSVGTLKQILWEARVRIPPAVVEKEELVERVWALVEEEKRKDNEGLEDVGFDMDEDEMISIEEPDGEEEVVVEMVDPESEAYPDVAHEHGQGIDHHATPDGFEHGYVEDDFVMAQEEHLSVPPVDFGLPPSRSSTPQPSTSPPDPSTSPSHSASKSKLRPHPKPTNAERSGLCVVCQDEEACIAIVDCGHLALCRECSDLILASSRECPLCRTRIVTEARLLRIFKA